MVTIDKPQSSTDGKFSSKEVLMARLKDRTPFPGVTEEMDSLCKGFIGRIANQPKAQVNLFLEWISESGNVYRSYENARMNGTSEEEHEKRLAEFSRTVGSSFERMIAAIVPEMVAEAEDQKVQLLRKSVFTVAREDSSEVPQIA